MPVSDGHKVEIVELKQLEKDYLLLDARLRLIRKNPDPALMSGRVAFILPLGFSCFSCIVQPV
jgi:hypothetical protein